MSEYQKIKARALAFQQEKEVDLQRELASKQQRDKQRARDEEEASSAPLLLAVTSLTRFTSQKRRQRETAAKDARRRELLQANAVLNRDELRSPAIMGNAVYDPFAEDEKRVMPAAIFATSIKTLKPKSSTGRASPNPAARAGPSRAGPSKSSTLKEKVSPPPLGRKEKAAQAFAQEAKPRAGDSTISIRKLVEAREVGPRRRTSPKQNTQPPMLQPIPPFSSFRKPDKSVSVSKTTGKRGRYTEDLQALCPDRTTRDRRTIDEIHRDIKARKVGTEGGAAELRTEKGAPQSRSPVKESLSRPTPVPSTARPIKSNYIPPPPRNGNAPLKRRSGSYSSASTSSSTSPPPSHKRLRSYSPPFSGGPSQNAISAQIQAMFRRPGRGPLRSTDLSDDGSSDMEAGMSDVEQEERRTAAIARKEDEAAEREERERRERKERTRKERMTR